MVMARPPCTFTASEIARALKGWKAAGIPVGSLEVSRDKIVIVAASDKGPASANKKTNEWDEVQ